MNKQRKKKVFLNFKGNYTEVVFTILSKNEQRASADHGEIIKQYSTAMSKGSGTISRILGEKKKDFMRHRKGTFYNFLKNTTNALCLDCTGHHSLYNSCKRGADHLSLPHELRVAAEAASSEREGPSQGSHRRSESEARAGALVLSQYQCHFLFQLRHYGKNRRQGS